MRSRPIRVLLAVGSGAGVAAVVNLATGGAPWWLWVPAGVGITAWGWPRRQSPAGAVRRLSELITLQEATLAGNGRIPGSDADTLTSRNDFARAYMLAGRRNEAITIYRTNLADSERILGRDHPDTLTSRHYLASAYESVGRLDEAITLRESERADRERIQGRYHLNTLHCRHFLAHAYASAGREAEMFALFETNLADFERILGPEDPITERAREDLAAARRLQFRW